MKGFSLTVLLIIVAILAAIGVGGYYLYMQKNAGQDVSPYSYTTTYSEEEKVLHEDLEALELEDNDSDLTALDSELSSL